jgi:hypothetical protein
MHFEMRNVCNILVGKLLGKEVPAVSKPRLVNNIKMDLGEIGCED